MPILDGATRAHLDRLIPSCGSSQNPVDATTQAIIQSSYPELARLIAGSDAVDAVIMIVSARLAASFEKEREALAAVTAGSHKPDPDVVLHAARPRYRAVPQSRRLPAVHRDAELCAHPGGDGALPGDPRRSPGLTLGAPARRDP